MGREVILTILLRQLLKAFVHTAATLPAGQPEDTPSCVRGPGNVSKPGPGTNAADGQVENKSGDGSNYSCAVEELHLVRFYEQRNDSYAFTLTDVRVGSGWTLQPFMHCHVFDPRGSGSQPTNDLGTCHASRVCCFNSPLSRLSCLCSGTLSATFCPDLPHSPTFLSGLIGVGIRKYCGNLQRAATGSRNIWIWYYPRAEPAPQGRGLGGRFLPALLFSS